LGLAIVMMGALTMGAAAHHQPGHSNGNTQVAGAVGLVAAVVQAQDILNDANVEILNIDSSFNNLRALNNVLRNADIDINVLSLEDFLNNVDVNVQDVLQNFLNENNILNNNVIGVAILSGGIVVFN
jgi:hypothetical protein